MEKIIRGVVSLLILLFSFLCIRYPLFNVHGMKQFPLILFIFSFSMSLVSLLFKNDIVPIFSASGYIIGFIVAFLFQSEGVDLGGGKTSNFWIIWSIIIFLFIVVGVIVSKLKEKA